VYQLKLGTAMSNAHTRKGTGTNDEALDAVEAARLIGSHVETLRRLARKGAIPAYKIGRDWRFNRGDILIWTRTHNIRTRQPCVLVVSGDLSTRRLIRAHMEPEGYAVALAPNGVDALDAARRQRPDSVVLDLDADGDRDVDVLQELRKVLPDLPAVLLAAHSDTRPLADELRCPPVMLLPKVAGGEMLLLSVRQLPDRSLSRVLAGNEPTAESHETREAT